MIDPKKYFIFSKGPKPLTLIFKVPGELPYFDGHFPGNPILPGVAIVDASLVAISEITKQDLFVKKIKSAKFLDLVQPHDEISLEIAETAPSSWTVTWSKLKDGTPHKTAEVIVQF